MKVQRLKEEKEAETVKLKEFENATTGIVSTLRQQRRTELAFSFKIRGVVPTSRGGCALPTSGECVPTSVGLPTSGSLP